MNSNLTIISDYLSTITNNRLLSHYNGEENFDFFNIKTPPIKDENDPFTSFLKKHNPLPEEYLTICLALIPHLLPGFLSKIITNNLPQSGDFAELGGVKGEGNRGFLPTGETALFLIAGEDLQKRKEALNLFSKDHWFRKKGILYLDTVKLGNSKTNGKLVLDSEYIELFTTGKVAPPLLSTDFPAQLLKSQQSWKDLVLPKNTFEQLDEIRIWVEHHNELLEDWGMSKKLKPGYRVLFHGPPGTGKTLTATLLGKQTGKDVFRIDLSNVVSKFIGETEKNLSNLFDKAQNKDWILFFDEADALFGKRTNVRDAHDKYANQEVSYLLQRIESFSGLVILASNFKSNIDDAFTRRFQSIIYFPIPTSAERFQLWKNAFPEKAELDKSIDLRSIAQKYELTGANIMNIVQYASLKALSQNTNKITLNDVLLGIRKELIKEGKVN